VQLSVNNEEQNGCSRKGSLPNLRFYSGSGQEVLIKASIAPLRGSRCQNQYKTQAAQKKVFREQRKLTQISDMEFESSMKISCNIRGR
jgi:hypothetical protein